MEDVVLASASNPAHRRNEMMACVKGLELIAEMRGDCAVFYTITCPSKYHATLMNGKPNPTRDHSTVRRAVITVDMFAAFRKAMHKKSCAGMAYEWRSRITTERFTGTCCALCVKTPPHYYRIIAPVCCTRRPGGTRQRYRRAIQVKADRPAQRDSGQLYRKVR